MSGDLADKIIHPQKKKHLPFKNKSILSIRKKEKEDDGDDESHGPQSLRAPSQSFSPGHDCGCSSDFGLGTSHPCTSESWAIFL